VVPPAQWVRFRPRPGVALGEDCVLVSHVVLDGHTRIGARNTFYPFCAIGVRPGLKYKGSTAVEIGDDNNTRMRDGEPPAL